MRSILFTAVALAVAALPSGAPVIRVDVGGGGDYLSISEGIAAAGAGDTVLVAPGTYTGELNRNMGASDGKLVISEAGRDATIIDCEYSGRAFSVGGGATIEGFTITHGEHEEGSAIYAAFSAAHVKDCLITENSGTAMDCVDPGGADWITVENCTFSRNGSGISSFAYLEVTDCEFIENRGTGVAGYGYLEWSSYCEVSGSRFHGNLGTGVGLCQTGGDVRWCVFTENAGGAVVVSMGSNIIYRCTMVNNSSPTGAVIYACGDWHGGPPPAVSRSIIAFNDCVGAIDGCSDTAVVHNIVFGNAGGDSLCGSYHDNRFEDPRLCDIYGGDVSPCADSFAIDWDAGAYEEAGCGACGTPVESVSWGSIKAMFR